MVTVTTKEEFKLALKNKEANILIKGDLAKKLHRKKKIKKTAILSGAGILLAGVALMPFTGGASLPASLIGFTATTAGGTTVVLSTAEFAMLSGVAVLGLGTVYMALLKDYTFEYTPDQCVKLTHK